MNALPALWSGVADEEPDLWLFAVIRRGFDADELSPQRMDALLRELTESASRRMRGVVLKTPVEEGRHLAIRASLERASLGLERRAKGDAERAVALLRESPFAALEAEGDAVVERASLRAEAVCSELRLTNPLASPYDGSETIELANAVEMMFLDRLARGELTIRRSASRLASVGRPRSIRSLRDVRTAFAMLDAFEARVALFRAFPPERLFAPAYELNALADAAHVALTRLFARLAARDSDEVRFDPTSEEIRRFERTRDDEETRARLVRWIESFVDARVAQARAKLARAYCVACLDAAAEVLPYLDGSPDDGDSDRP